jgi:6-phosphogluconate dehydrogenase
VLSGPERRVDTDRQQLVDDVRQALWSSKVVAYAQGLEEIRRASEEYDWDVDIATVARIWRGGCIIRARLLKQISDEYAANRLPTLLVAPSIKQGLAERLPAALVQGLRDNFGAHTYRRTDVSGSFHTLWSQDRSEVQTS